MEFEYYFEKKTKHRVSMHILPNESIKGDAFMVEAWLQGDVQSEYLYERMKNFMESPDMEVEELGGNSCDVIAKRDFTTIRWIWYDQMPESCTLPTQMLYEILQIWVAKNNELREERKKEEENK